MVVRLSSAKGLPPAVRKLVREAEARERKGQKRTKGATPAAHARRERLTVGDGLTDLERAFLCQVADAGLPAPDRCGHDKWHPIPGRKLEIDVAWQRFGLAVELHGGVSAGLPSHTSRKNVARDHEKAALCTAQGITFLAFTDAMVSDGRALAILRAVLERCG